MADMIDVVIGAVVGRCPPKLLDELETIDYFDLRKSDYGTAFDFLKPVYKISPENISTVPPDDNNHDYRFYICGECVLSFNGIFLLVLRKKSLQPLENELWLKMMHNIDVTFDAMDLV